MEIPILFLLNPIFYLIIAGDNQTFEFALTLKKPYFTVVQTLQESKIPSNTFFLPTLVLRIKHNFWLSI